MVRHDRIAAALGIGLTGLGLLGLVPGVELGLTAGHDLAHLGPGLALTWAGLWAPSSRSTRAVTLAAGGSYLGLGLLSLALPARIPALLGIPTAANLVHVLLGGGLLAVGLELGPVSAPPAGETPR